MGNSASLDVSEKRNPLLLPGTEPRFLGCRSRSLLTVLTVIRKYWWALLKAVMNFGLWLYSSVITSGYVYTAQ
jgi:hypothetical protein